jgi:hypothetical protein
MELSRRRFLRASALAAGGWGVSRHLGLKAQTTDPVLLPSFVADVNGNGALGTGDEQLVRRALFARRGFGLKPNREFDPRADVLGRGVVDQHSLDSVVHTVEAQASGVAEAESRPITVAWHYGWYNAPARPPGLQTVRFKGGDYRSNDEEVETLFNDQKNEFGITVDALSWIPKRKNSRLLDNYRQGILRTPNLSTRHLALLYESTIALPASGGRMDFSNPAVPALLRQDFERMGRFLAEAREAGGRVFTLDGRPVMFIFGSHSWGILPVGSGQFTAIEIALDAAREAFRSEYGEVPFIVGEEMSLAADGILSEDRARRMASFDATHTYHHALSKAPDVAPEFGAELLVTPGYVEHQISVLRHNFNLIDEITNRYTGNPVLLIPNLAAGFAKPGLKSLLMGRDGYADFLTAMRDAYIDLLNQGRRAEPLGTARLPAPVYIVGSWNEEFEGHAVFPASFNRSVPTVTQRGFDLVMAIKAVFGWNHYAVRDIVPG